MRSQRRRTHRPLPGLAKRETAWLIAQALTRRADGRSPADPATWLCVAADLGVAVYPFTHAHGQRALYRGYPSEGATRGLIEFNDAYPPIEQARALVHELAHHYLCSWQPPLLADWADAYGYDDDPRCVHHQIARRVEKEIVG